MKEGSRVLIKDTDIPMDQRGEGRRGEVRGCGEDENAP